MEIEYADCFHCEHGVMKKMYEALHEQPDEHGPQRSVRCKRWKCDVCGAIRDERIEAEASAKAYAA